MMDAAAATWDALCAVWWLTAIVWGAPVVCLVIEVWCAPVLEDQEPVEDSPGGVP